MGLDDRLAAYGYIFAREQRKGREVLSSSELATELAMNSTQVRRDLSETLGKLGRRGVGYTAGPVLSALKARSGRPGVLLIGAARTRGDFDAFVDVDHTGPADVEELIRRAAALAAVIDAIVERQNGAKR